MISVSSRFRAGLLCTFLAGTALFSQAGDIVKKRDGTTLDGTILSDTDTEVRIEVTDGGIKEIKTISKKDIKEVIHATPDQVEAARLTGLDFVPSKDRLSDAGYQKILDEDLLPFLKKFPTSPHKSKVEGVIKTYQEEMAKAKTGAQKIDGQWVTSQELQWNAYNIEARLRRIEMEKALQKKEKDYLAAYQIMSALERDKPASVETNKAIELFKASIPGFDELLDLRILEQPIQAKQTADSLKSLTPDEKRNYEVQKKQNEEDFKAKVEEARKLKLGLLPFNELDLKSIQDTKAALKKEAERLNKLDLAKDKAAAEAFQTGLKNLFDKNYLSAKKNFEEAGKAFPKESFIKERLDVAKRAADEEAKVKAEAGPVTPAPAAADAKKAPAPAKTAAGAPVKPATATPAKESSSEGEVPAEEEKSSMPLYLIAGAAALLLIGLLVKALSKKKRGDDD